MFLRVLVLIPAILFFFACEAELPETEEGAEEFRSIVARDLTLILSQNSRAILDLKNEDATKVTITKNPEHGVVSLIGTVATYRLTNPLHVGSDSFSFKLSNAQTTSNEASVVITVSALASGETPEDLTETYENAQFSLEGWKSYSSSYGHTADSIVEFSTGTYGGVAVPTRNFGIYGDVSSYAGDSKYNSLFSTLPVDGYGDPMQDWPWKADLLHRPECGVDATVTMKIDENFGQNPLVSVLLNYDIETNAKNQKELTGYQVLVNGGGGSVTLSRFNKAHELATAYLDRWPSSSIGNEGGVNPIISGPYKGWNYTREPWAAGGRIGVNGNTLIAVRYQYDVETKNTTVSYELRKTDGTDKSPESWDVVVNLTGEDSLPPGGSFGLMGVNYHNDSVIVTTDFDVSEYKLVCNLP